MAWGTGQALSVPQPPVCIPRGEPKGPPSCPRLCPLRHAGTSPLTPVGADLMPARPVPPGGCQEAARPRLSARIGHSGSLATVRAAGSLTPPRARVSVVSPTLFFRRRPGRNAHTPLRESLRSTLIGCHKLR